MCHGHLSKDGGVFSGVSKRVDVPGHPGTAAFTEGVIQESQPQSHLIYDCAVVCGGLVTHAPATIDKLKTTYEEKIDIYKIHDIWEKYFLLWLKI